MFDHRDLPLLVTFARVCREGSITAAARTLGLSKSVVSTQLKAIEAALGGRLLHRTTRSLEPTQAGFDLLAVAERVAAATDEARSLAAAPWVAHASFVQTKRYRFRRADGTTQELSIPLPRGRQHHGRASRADRRRRRPRNPP